MRSRRCLLIAISERFKSFKKPKMLEIVLHTLNNVIYLFDFFIFICILILWDASKMHICINIKSYIVKKMFREDKWILLQNNYMLLILLAMDYTKLNISFPPSPILSLHIFFDPSERSLAFKLIIWAKKRHYEKPFIELQ